GSDTPVRGRMFWTCPQQRSLTVRFEIRRQGLQLGRREANGRQSIASAEASARTRGGPLRNLSSIVFLACGTVDVFQAGRFLRVRRRRRVSSDFGERLTPRQAAHDLVLGIALHLRIEHFEGAATGVGLVVMSKIRKAFEHAKKVLIPRTAQD